MLEHARSVLGPSVLYLRTEPCPWSPIDIAQHVVEGISRSASVLQGLNNGADAVLLVVEAPFAQLPTASLDEVVTALADACGALAVAASRAADERPASAAELIRRAAHEGVHHGLELSAMTNGTPFGPVAQVRAIGAV